MNPPQNNAEEMHRRKWLKVVGIDPEIIEPEKINVFSATTDKFSQLAAELIGGMSDLLMLETRDYEFGQIPFYKGRHWLGAVLWRRARKQSYARDRWLGWHACQQASRLSLVAECIHFMPRWHAEGISEDYGKYAIWAATAALQEQWKEHFGYEPLLADRHQDPNEGRYCYFEQNGWKRTTDKHPRVAPSHWVMELVPDAKEIITAKHLDKRYAGGPETGRDGILPIPDELLSSYKDAFKRVFDPRENNRHYPLESVLAITLMALISGADSVNSILKFSTRLSGRQAQLLGLPCDESDQKYDLPNYHVYYRVLNRVDFMLVAESLIGWLKEHMTALHQVLHPDGDVIRDSLLTLAQRFRHRPKPLVTDFELPIGVDPDAPDGIKRDAQGNLVD